MKAWDAQRAPDRPGEFVDHIANPLLAKLLAQHQPCLRIEAKYLPVNRMRVALAKLKTTLEVAGAPASAALLFADASDGHKFADLVHG